MKRRELLAALGSAGVLGSGAVLYSRRNTGEQVDPVVVETLDAPGSEAGEMTVPESGRVTFLEVFATWCSTCRGMMPVLRDVHEQVDDVQFVSVSNEALGVTVERAGVADWWREHGGEWTVGVDHDLALTSEFDVREIPATFVIDRENRIRHADAGAKSAETLTNWIESAHE